MDTPPSNPSTRTMDNVESNGGEASPGARAKELFGAAKRRGSLVAKDGMVVLGRAGSFVGKEIVRDQLARDNDPALIYVLRGMAKGFLVYSIPISMLSRKPAGFRRGVILAVFVGLVRTFDRLFRYMNRKGATPLPFNLEKRLSPYALSGGLAAFIGVMLDKSLLNSTFAFWCIVRALRCLPLPEVPHGPTIVMCISAAQILTTWIVTPKDLPGGYRRFLDIHGDQIGARKGINKRASTDGHFCANVHPNSSHLGYTLSFAKGGLLRAIPVYLPLYLLFFAFSGRYNFASIKRLIINTLQSSTFLASYCTIAYISGCLYYNTFIGARVRRLNLMLHLWTAGLATLIERPSRRPELAAYCMTFALETVYRRCKALNLVRSRKWVAALVITLTASIMMHHHDKQPRVVMKWLFGVV